MGESLGSSIHDIQNIRPDGAGASSSSSSSITPDKIKELRETWQVKWTGLQQCLRLITIN